MAIGNLALSTAIGGNNVAIGASAGSNLTSGSNNILIGNNAQAPVAGGSNQLNIGGWIYGSGGNIGVGNANPAYKLDISGDTQINGGWLRVKGTNGIYFQDYGGGWNMTDTTWIRAYNGKSIYTP